MGDGVSEESGVGRARAWGLQGGLVERGKLAEGRVKWLGTHIRCRIWT